MYLAINTASRKNALALLTKKEMLLEREWKTDADEAKKLFSHLKELFASKKLRFENLAGIVAITGPGAFSAIRVGVTTANIIAAMYKIPVFPLDLATLENIQKKKQCTFAEAVLDWLSTNPKPEKIAKPTYSSPPNITKTKKCRGISFKS